MQPGAAVIIEQINLQASEHYRQGLEHPPADLAQAAEAVARLITETSEPIAPAVLGLNGATVGRSREELDAAVAAALSFVGRPCSVDREVELYVATGCLVEAGADPTIGWDHLQSRLTACLTRLVEAGARLAELGFDLDRGESPGETFSAEVQGWAAAFTRLVVAAMARLTRDPALRAQARPELAPLVRRLHATSGAYHAMYLDVTLGVLDGPVLVIDLDTQGSALVKATAVRSCAHLIAMLDGACEDTECWVYLDDFLPRRRYASLGCLDGVADQAGDTRLIDVDTSSARTADAFRTHDLAPDMSGLKIPTFDLPGHGLVPVVVRLAPGTRPRALGTLDFQPIHDELIDRVGEACPLSPDEHSAMVPQLLGAARALRARTADAIDTGMLRFADPQGLDCDVVNNIEL